MRNLLTLVGGMALCVCLIAVATFVVLRATAAGDLMIATEAARDDPEALRKALAGYDDPFELVVERVPRLLDLSAFAVAAAVGLFVGRFASIGAWWVSLLGVLPMTVLRLFSAPASWRSWLLAGAWTLVSWGTAALVMRRRISIP